MQDLTLVGLSEDRQRLVLVSDAGEEFSLPADARLWAALRGDHARLAQLENQMDSVLRPRDIQARIRAGESPEAVAAAASTTVEKIMGFANPVLAERAHIADRAQRASVRRRAGEGPSRLLGDAVAERLRSHNLDPETVLWDAWRREDGRWTLVADYRLGGQPHHAEFVFDAPGRYVLAEDDEARSLVGEPVSRPAAGADRSRPGIGAVGAADQELPLGEDALDLVAEPGAAEHPTGDPSTEHPAAEDPTEDLTRTAAAVRGHLPGGTADADWMATQASERPTPAAPQAGAAPAEAGPDDAAERPEEPGAEAGEQSDQQPTAEPAEEPAEEPAKPANRRSAKKGRGRASVPSWDEIMFGGGGGRE